MLDDLPAEKIPELLESRDGYKSLLDHLQSIKHWVDEISRAIPAHHIDSEAGGTFEGPVAFNGGAVMTEDNTLIVNGTSKFFGVTELNNGVASVANVETDGIFGVNTVVASISERALEDTDWHNVIDYAPTVSSNYLIYLYIRVSSPDTSLNLILEYTDAGGLQNQIILSNSIQGKGSYSISPIFINAIANYPIRLKAMAGKSNQAFISASVVGL